MAYIAPYIDASGLHVNEYNDIIQDMEAKARGIFGDDIYLENDSQDHQLLSVFAKKVADSNNGLRLVYNNMSPGNAVGAALSSLVKINGLVRKPVSYSTCQVTITGTAGSTITNGVVSDVNGYKWGLPGIIQLISAAITVTAVCQTPGAIAAAVGAITQIVTPRAGWISVTNETAAVPGLPVELDGTLRARQAISTSAPAQTPLEATRAAIAAVEGVSRYECYENDTNVPDANGLPAHSIAAVVEGGVDEDVAEAVRKRKTLGCSTYGTTAVTVQDRYGRNQTINIFRPGYIDIDVVIAVTALAGYTSATTAAIKQAAADYLESLSIGADLQPSALWYEAQSVMADIRTPTFRITALTVCVHGGSPGTNPVAIAFNEVTRGNTAYITVNVT
jgi:uncharacterized phage protein gp47/JayE